MRKEIDIVYLHIKKSAIVLHLQYRGYDAELLVPEEEDISLQERVRRANKITCQIGRPAQETLLVSIHVNAAGSGLMWHNATGWCAYAYYGHSLSDELADCLYNAAQKHLAVHRRKQQINAEKFAVLGKRKVTAFPDVDGFTEWTEHLHAIPGLNVTIADVLQKEATLRTSWITSISPTGC